jgi:hypothetical protein
VETTLMAFKLDIASVVQLQVAQNFGQKVLQVLKRAVIANAVADKFFKTNVKRSAVLVS